MLPFKLDRSKWEHLVIHDTEPRTTWYVRTSWTNRMPSSCRNL